MTACAIEGATGDGGTAEHAGCVIAADGSYAARLVAPDGGDAWYPERWTLDGPEPYAVPLPGNQPEEPDSQLLPLTDGRVLIVRRVDGRHRLVLLYPTGPATGELSLGALECDRLTLLPPAPDGRSAYALAPGAQSTTVWQVAGGSSGPERVAEVPGHCWDGGWLDRDGRLLALNRKGPAAGAAGRTKAVAVDLGRGGETSPLLQIAEDSDDLLLLADPDSGLLLVRSNAPGDDRIGWGVLGSHRPVRFPEALHPHGVSVLPFAIQPGQMLMPESCAVALRVDGPNGTGVAVWRPAERELRQLTAPEGWLRGTGLFTRNGELRLPYAPCGLARIQPPTEPVTPQPDPMTPASEPLTEPRAEPPADTTHKPVPLQEAPLP
ncbi:hypothetical protein [Streptomyces gobiensis]|uniref:hypothetical protein n=1 Tax=Streptomyces gobiensis TaxID=2875706 RepID=UPI001E5D75D8|nr:hypothetical protein [Streptomyces gobiensis]UGY91108.1 hypothetical protein test1122_04810 [Streptomyces gobiensis]